MASRLALVLLFANAKIGCTMRTQANLSEGSHELGAASKAKLLMIDDSLEALLAIRGIVQLADATLDVLDLIIVQMPDLLDDRNQWESLNNKNFDAVTRNARRQEDPAQRFDPFVQTSLVGSVLQDCEWLKRVEDFLSSKLAIETIPNLANKTGPQRARRGKRDKRGTTPKRSLDHKWQSQGRFLGPAKDEIKFKRWKKVQDPQCVSDMQEVIVRLRWAFSDLSSIGSKGVRRLNSTRLSYQDFSGEQDRLCEGHAVDGGKLVSTLVDHFPVTKDHPLPPGELATSCRDFFPAKVDADFPRRCLLMCLDIEGCMGVTYQEMNNFTRACFHTDVPVAKEQAGAVCLRAAPWRFWSRSAEDTSKWLKAKGFDLHMPYNGLALSVLTPLYMVQRLGVSEEQARKLKCLIDSEMEGDLEAKDCEPEESAWAKLRDKFSMATGPLEHLRHFFVKSWTDGLSEVYLWSSLQKGLELARQNSFAKRTLHTVISGEDLAELETKTEQEASAHENREQTEALCDTLCEAVDRGSFSPVAFAQVAVHLFNQKVDSDFDDCPTVLKMLKPMIEGDERMVGARGKSSAAAPPE